MRKFFAEQRLIKKYKSVPNIVKAMGKEMNEITDYAKNKKWTTISLLGEVDNTNCNLTVHVRLKNGEIKIDNPQLIIENK